jgi:hypothetical protein
MKGFLGRPWLWLPLIVALPVLAPAPLCALEGVMVALWLIFGFERANDFHFFYLLFLPVSWIAMRAGFAGAATGLCLIHLMLVALIGWGDYPTTTFMAYQILMLSLAVTGLLLGAVVDERRRSEELLRGQHAEVARMARHATAGAMGVTLAHQISQPLSNVAMYLHVGRRLLAAEPRDTRPVADALDKAASQPSEPSGRLARLSTVRRRTACAGPTPPPGCRCRRSCGATVRSRWLPPGPVPPSDGRPTT